MARHEDREKAIKLRLAGKSYSEIKERLNIGKGTLSAWLHSYPLSRKQIQKLRDWNPKRIERFRNTMKKKKEMVMQRAYLKAKKDISCMTKRELLISGFFLYWAEGTKTTRYTTCLANTDPAMIKFFIRWLALLGVGKDRLHVRLHLYADMDAEKYTKFWSKELNIPLCNFRKPYIKKSKLDNLTHKGGYGHGTCNIIFGNREVNDYILMGIKYIKEYTSKT
ncbi:MAG: helix-turn-helix domain-containing protein [Candidatus Lloydbacteria bacterium]|nr:helix-turn-helix domain-containing protein [Candidatus Lloydbacteria bacterium]